MQNKIFWKNHSLKSKSKSNFRGKQAAPNHHFWCQSDRVDKMQQNAVQEKSIALKEADIWAFENLKKFGLRKKFENFFKFLKNY